MLTIDGRSLPLDDVDAFLQGRFSKVSVAAGAGADIAKGRAAIEAILAHGQTVYGINTGFGKLASKAIDAADLKTPQKNLLLSHAVRVGKPLEVPVARLALLLEPPS